MNQLIKHWKILTALLIISIASFLYFVQRTEGIEIKTSQEIPESIILTRHYSDSEVVLYENSLVTNDKQEIVASNGGESRISLTFGNQTKDIIGSLDTSVGDYYLRITVVSFDEDSGEAVLKVYFHDGLSRTVEQVIFDSFK